VARGTQRHQLDHQRLGRIPAILGRNPGTSPQGTISRAESQLPSLARRLPEVGPIPVSVIDHGRSYWIPEAFELNHADLDLAEQTWHQYQLNLAAKFTRSSFRIATNSGHLIPVDHPELVVREIRSLLEMFEQAR
jgi:hypothetical protein